MSHTYVFHNLGLRTGEDESCHTHIGQKPSGEDHLVKNQVVRMSHVTHICSSQLGFEGALLGMRCVCMCVRVCICDVTHSRGGWLC